MMEPHGTSSGIGIGAVSNVMRILHARTDKKPLEDTESLGETTGGRTAMWLKRLHHVSFMLVYLISKEVNTPTWVAYVQALIANLQMLYYAIADPHFKWYAPLKSAIRPVLGLVSLEPLSSDSSLSVLGTTLVVVVCVLVVTMLTCVHLCRQLWHSDALQSLWMLPILQFTLQMLTTIFFEPVIAVLTAVFEPSANSLHTVLVPGSGLSNAMILLVGLIMAVFILFNTFMAMVLVDNNPLSMSATAQVHGRVEASTLLLRALVGLQSPVQYMLPMWFTVGFLLFCSGAMTGLQVYYLPFYRQDMNRLYAVTNAIFLWGCVCLAAAQLIGNDADLGAATAFVLGLVPFLLVVAWAVDRRAEYLGTLEPQPHTSPYMAELMLRFRFFGMTPARGSAESCFAGAQTEYRRVTERLFRDNPYMLLHLASLLRHLGHNELLSAQLFQRVRALQGATVDHRFLIFRHMQRRRERMHGTEAGALSYMAFTHHRKQSEARISETLQAISEMWNLVRKRKDAQRLLYAAAGVYHRSLEARKHLDELVVRSHGSRQAVLLYALYADQVLEDHVLAAQLTKVARTASVGSVSDAMPCSELVVSGSEQSFGLVLACSEDVLTTFGLDRSNVVGFSVLQLLPSPVDQAFLHTLRRYLAMSTDFSTFALNVWAKDEAAACCREYRVTVVVTQTELGDINFNCSFVRAEADQPHSAGGGDGDEADHLKHPHHPHHPHHGQPRAIACVIDCDEGSVAFFSEGMASEFGLRSFSGQHLELLALVPGLREALPANGLRALASSAQCFSLPASGGDDDSAYVVHALPFTVESLLTAPMQQQQQLATALGGAGGAAASSLGGRRGRPGLVISRGASSRHVLRDERDEAEETEELLRPPFPANRFALLTFVADGAARAKSPSRQLTEAELAVEADAEAEAEVACRPEDEERSPLQQQITSASVRDSPVRAGQRQAGVVRVSLAGSASPMANNSSKRGRSGGRSSQAGPSGTGAGTGAGASSGGLRSPSGGADAAGVEAAESRSSGSSELSKKSRLKQVVDDKIATESARLTRFASLCRRIWSVCVLASAFLYAWDAVCYKTLMSRISELKLSSERSFSVMLAAQSMLESTAQIAEAAEAKGSDLTAAELNALVGRMPIGSSARLARELHEAAIASMEASTGGVYASQRAGIWDAAGVQEYVLPNGLDPPGTQRSISFDLAIMELASAGTSHNVSDCTGLPLACDSHCRYIINNAAFGIVLKALDLTTLGRDAVKDMLDAQSFYYCASCVSALGFVLLLLVFIILPVFRECENTKELLVEMLASIPLLTVRRLLRAARSKRSRITSRMEGIRVGMQQGGDGFESDEDAGETEAPPRSGSKSQGVEEAASSSALVTTDALGGESSKLVAPTLRSTSTLASILRKTTLGVVFVKSGTSKIAPSPAGIPEEGDEAQLPQRRSRRSICDFSFVAQILRVFCPLLAVPLYFLIVWYMHVQLTGQIVAEVETMIVTARMPVLGMRADFMLHAGLTDPTQASWARWNDAPASNNLTKLLVDILADMEEAYRGVIYGSDKLGTVVLNTKSNYPEQYALMFTDACATESCVALLAMERAGDEAGSLTGVGGLKKGTRASDLKRGLAQVIRVFIDKCYLALAGDHSFDLIKFDLTVEVGAALKRSAGIIQTLIESQISSITDITTVLFAALCVVLLAACVQVYRAFARISDDLCSAYQILLLIPVDAVDDDILVKELGLRDDTVR